MAFDHIDFRRLKCPSRCVVDALNHYLDGVDVAGRATFAIPVIEIDDDGNPCSEAQIMLTTTVTDSTIGLIGEKQLSTKHVVIQLPFCDREATEVKITHQTEYRSAWLYEGTFEGATPFNVTRQPACS